MAASYIKMFYDFIDKTARLSDEEVGRLVKAMLIYARDGVEIDLPGNEDFLFPVFKAQIAKDASSYAEVSAKRKAAGAKGGKAKQANASKSYQEVIHNNDDSNNNCQSVVVGNPLDTTVSTEDSTYKGLGVSEAIIALAKERAAQYGHTDDRQYILAIIRDWKRNGVQTVEDAQRVIAEHDSCKRASTQPRKDHGYQTHDYTEADFGADFYYDPTRDASGVTV